MKTAKANVIKQLWDADTRDEAAGAQLWQQRKQRRQRCLCNGVVHWCCSFLANKRLKYVRRAAGQRSDSDTDIKRRNADDGHPSRLVELPYAAVRHNRSKGSVDAANK